jgi:hypothetical protein
MLVIDLIERVAMAMQGSRLQYQFSPSPRRASSQQLGPLALMNRGLPRRTDGQIRLTPVALEDGATIRTLATDRYRFAHEKCIDRGNRFVFHLG